LAIRRLTVNSQNLREYGGSNQTSGIHGTFYDILCKGRAVLGADKKYITSLLD